MVRVPDTKSLTHILGEPVVADAPLPYAHLTPTEIDQLIIRCRRALHGHHRDSLSADPDVAEDALKAREAVQQILLDLWQSAPETKRAKIEAILRRY